MNGRIIAVINVTAIAGFVFLAWHFGHWWIALFAILFLFEWKGGNDG